MARAAEILFRDRRAGLLTETACGGTRFVYDPGWAEPIACTFPSSRRVHDWPTGLHPFFEHLGPEGWLRERQARIAHVAEEDDFGLLLRYGRDCIGAVGLRPLAGESLENDLPQAEATNTGRTVSGVQAKLLVVADGRNGYQPAGPEGPAPFIAKFNSASIGTLVRNELRALQWTAEVLGPAEVTKFAEGSVRGLGPDGGDVMALIVSRFDRTAAGRKLRLEDFAQILAKPRGLDYGGKYDGDYGDVARIIWEHTSRPEIDLARFFKRLVAFILIGNCDAHLKNWSLLETPTGLRLSPAYDVLNTSIYDGFDQGLALKIGGRKVQLDAVTRRLMEGFGASIGLTHKAVSTALADLGRRAAKARAILQPPAAAPPGDFLDRYLEIVDGTCLRILAT